MLANRTASQPSTFTISVLDDAGVIVPAVSASWELFDARGVSIAAGAIADFDPIADSVTFQVDASDLALPDGSSSVGREIVVFLTDSASETTELRDYFLVVSSQPLALMQNSFITYPEALALRGEFAQLPGWDANERTAQAAALAQAHRNICRMSFKVPGHNGSADNQKKAYWGTGAESIFYDRGGRRVRVSTLTLEEFDALPEKFARALKRAQIAEADALLGGNPIADKRKAGIISETIGETSAFFQSKPYLNLPITRAAYEEVQRYVYMKIGVERS